MGVDVITRIVKHSQNDCQYQIYESWYRLKKKQIFRFMNPFDFEDLTGIELKHNEVAKIMIERLK